MPLDAHAARPRARPRAHASCAAPTAARANPALPPPLPARARRSSQLTLLEQSNSRPIMELVLQAFRVMAILQAHEGHIRATPRDLRWFTQPAGPYQQGVQPGGHHRSNEGYYVVEHYPDPHGTTFK